MTPDVALGREFGAKNAWVLPGALVLGVILLHLLAGWHSKGPVVFDDEGAYLRIGRWLAGEGPRPGVKYFPGYSVLVAPLHWVTATPGALFHAVKGLNVALGALGALAAWGVAGALVGSGRRWHRVAVAVPAAVYPSTVLFSSQAFAENALVAGALVLAWRLGQSARDGWTAARVAEIALLSGFLATVHARGAAFVVGAGLVVGVGTVGRRRERLVGVGVLAVVLAVGAALVAALGAGAASGEGSYGLGDLAGERAGVTGVVDVLIGAAGQVLYLTLVTGGVVVMAVRSGVPKVVQWGRGDRSPEAAVTAFCLVSAALVFVISALFISPGAAGGRADTVIYGRYNEAVIGLVIMVGAAALVRSRPRDLLRWFAGVLVVAGLAAAAVQGAQRADLLAAPVTNPFNVLAAYPVLDLLGRVAPLGLAAITVVGAGVVAVVTWRRRWAGVGLLVAAFLAVALAMAWGPLRSGARERAGQRVLVDAIEVAGSDAGCVALDRHEASMYHLYSYRFWADSVRFEWFDSGDGEVPCGFAVVSSRPDLASEYPGASVLATERGDVARLWRLQSPSPPPSPTPPS